MGKLILLLGKSASGKDSIAKAILKEYAGRLTGVIPYTTRPIRIGEKEGVTYRYVSVETMEEMERQGRVLERRDYETVNGQWSYFTADDGQFAEDAGDTLLIGTPEVYRGLVKTLGADRIVPVLVEVDDEERLFRSIWREKKQTVPNYAEVCRRFLADEKDYAPEVLEELFGMRLNRIYNWSFEACLIQARELLSGILGK